MRINQQPGKVVLGKIANNIEGNPIYSPHRSLLLSALSFPTLLVPLLLFVSSYHQDSTFYSVSDASARFRICDCHLFDCSVRASPNLRMPLAFPRSRNLSFCYHTLAKHPCRIRRPPTTVLLSYNTKVAGFLFLNWHEYANGKVRILMNNELIAEYGSRTRSGSMTFVLHHRWPSPIVDLCQKSKHTSVG